MLFPKPIILAWKNSSKKKKEHQPLASGNTDLDSSNLSASMDDSQMWNEESDEGLMAAEKNNSGEEDDAENEVAKKESHSSGHGHDEPFGELMVHQLIEVIEFVLGSVSNTASYLRLWALSLAHSQLAEVFYNLLLEPHLTEGNIFVRVFGITFGFMMLANVTVGVLMCMDLMECFLHALRLHW